MEPDFWKKNFFGQKWRKRCEKFAFFSNFRFLVCEPILNVFFWKFGHGKIITKIWKFEVKVIISRQFYFEISGIRLEGGIFKLPTNLLKTWETLNQPLSRVPLASKWRKAAKFVNFEPSLTTKYFFKNGKIITKILNFEAKVIIFRQLYFEISGIWLEGGISNLPPKSPRVWVSPKSLTAGA